MGAWGAIIMGFFGSVFAALTLALQFHLGGAVLAVPFVLFAGIALAAAQILRSPGNGIQPSPRAERAIMWSSIGEGVGLFVVANLVQNLHRPELLLPAMALVVGLHFLPIAYAAPFRPFYALGGALIMAAIAGVVVGAPTGGMAAGFAAATSLWIAAALALRRDMRARGASVAT
ncbi:hypothetical protein [Sphingomonas pruni]|jgi:hypothetical protein|uniref:hypothetical protein n=1 Tax=Sphingomonas pruni TaxID=40683 RepID=UPI00082C3DE4|nr:hypothetical protein [Sphingomonas pruni]